MKAINLFLFAAISSLLISCAHVNSVSLTPIPVNKQKVVRAERSKMVFLGFNFNNDFIDEMVNDLKMQCPNGVVTGILTKDQTIGYVLFFNHIVTAEGYCITPQQKVTQNIQTQRPTL